MSLDADLIAYYDAEARSGRRADPGQLRQELRAGFAELLTVEGRSRILDVGAGPGLDTRDWVAEGFEAVGLDLGIANCEVMRQRGLAAVAGSLYSLPLRTGAFHALWTMSTFVHVPHDRFDEAVTEMLRVVQPGAPLGIGTWGGFDFEGHPAVGDLRPFRFFSLASHGRWHEMLARHGDVEVFETHHPNPVIDWQYQFAVLRSPS